MFDHTHYVPILKGKRGEFKALSDLEPVVRANLTPVIEIPFISQYAKNDSVEHHILREADYIANYWGIHSSIFIDLRMMNPSKRTNTGEHPLPTLASIRQHPLRAETPPLWSEKAVFAALRQPLQSAAGFPQ